MVSPRLPQLSAGFACRSFAAMALFSSLAMPSLVAMAHADTCCPPQEQRTLSTSGHGEIKLKPDALRFSVSVEASANSMVETRNQVNKKMQAIITALKTLAVPNLQLQTENLSVNPVYASYEKNKLPRKIGYQAHYTLSVEVTKLKTDVLGDTGSRLMDAALDAGAQASGGIQFFLDDVQSARALALEKAVKDGLQNATVMAKAANTVLGPVLSLDGSPQYHVGGGGYMHAPMMARAVKMDAVAESVPVETGEVTMTSDISIRFKLGQ